MTPVAPCASELVIFSLPSELQPPNIRSPIDSPACLS